jgi:hypothetical protein
MTFDHLSRFRSCPDGSPESTEPTIPFVSLVQALNSSHTRLVPRRTEANFSMKSIALGFCLLLVVFLNFSAAREQTRITDEDGVRAAVTDYIESYYTGDASRMEKSLHPHYLKHSISNSDGKLRMTEWTGLQMVEEVRSNGPAPLPASEKTEKVTVLDVADGIASAKLVTPHWIDYLTLSKWNGQWKIVSVVLTETH